MNSESGLIQPRVSVVIATLGGAGLKDTIEQLNLGSVIPEEILICIPEELADRVSCYEQANVRVVKTPFRGQVAQRVAGFAQAVAPYVMQLDDDTSVDRRCVEQLVEVLCAKGTRCSVAPAVLSKDSNRSIYVLPLQNWVTKIYYWALNGQDGLVPGGVTKAGTCNGIDPAVCGDGLFEVEWIPGACAMHHREDLVLDRYFPYSGKAYSEDLIHSYLLRQRGARLYVQCSARCWTEMVSPFHFPTFREFWRATMADLKTRRYYVVMSGRSLSRMYFYYLKVSLAFLVVLCRRRISNV